MDLGLVAKLATAPFSVLGLCGLRDKSGDKLQGTKAQGWFSRSLWSSFTARQSDILACLDGWDWRCVWTAVPSTQSPHPQGDTCKGPVTWKEMLDTRGSHSFTQQTSVEYLPWARAARLGSSKARRLGKRRLGLASWGKRQLLGHVAPALLTLHFWVSCSCLM
ncbi:unnamed protein product [Gulo gulo]|uniref:Uncharacterized protein n=1 Tax=Gulo gulo TaxID=48420 RepID=A0A9X9LWA4_GULGU|nr:unnamed protein product [Gulo gulo]